MGKIDAVWKPEGILSEDHLTEEQKKDLEEFISEQFKEENCQKTIGRTTLVEHVIDTGTAKPIKQRYDPMSPALLKIL